MEGEAAVCVKFSSITAQADSGGSIPFPCSEMSKCPWARNTAPKKCSWVALPSLWEKSDYCSWWAGTTSSHQFISTCVRMDECWLKWCRKGPHKCCQFINSLQYLISEYKLNNSDNSNYKTTYLIYVISSTVSQEVVRVVHRDVWKTFLQEAEVHILCVRQCPRRIVLMLS